MSDVLEDELRAALNDRAAGLSPWVLEDLVRTDFWARSRPLRIRVALWPAVGTAVAALAAGVVAVVVLLSSGTSAAWAGWTPTPSIAPAAAVRSATAACKAMHLPHRMAEAMTGTPVLTDQRGPYTAAIYESHGDVSDCISNGTPGKGTYAGFSALLRFRAFPGPDQLGTEVTAGGGGTAPFHYAGRAGSDIAAVAFILPEGTTVSATVQHGWYFAWWPQNHWPTAVRLTTTTGHTITSPMPGPNAPDRAPAPSRATGQAPSPAAPPAPTTTEPHP